MDSSKPGRIAIIGAGITGLTCAHILAQKGFTPTIYERTDRAGGRIKDFRLGSSSAPLGAAILGGSYHNTLNLFGELGVRSRLASIPLKSVAIRQGNEI